MENIRSFYLISLSLRSLTFLFENFLQICLLELFRIKKFIHARVVEKIHWLDVVEFLEIDFDWFQVSVFEADRFYEGILGEQIRR